MLHQLLMKPECHKARNNSFMVKIRNCGRPVSRQAQVYSLHYYFPTHQSGYCRRHAKKINPNHLP
jgi:hypothetical protein